MTQTIPFLTSRSRASGVLAWHDVQQTDRGRGARAKAATKPLDLQAMLPVARAWPALRADLALLAGIKLSGLAQTCAPYRGHQDLVPSGPARAEGELDLGARRLAGAPTDELRTDQEDVQRKLLPAFVHGESDTPTCISLAFAKV